MKVCTRCGEECMPVCKPAGNWVGAWMPAIKDGKMDETEVSDCCLAEMSEKVSK